MEKDCYNCKYELYEAHEPPCDDCGIDDRKYWKPKPQTNADRIRSMSDEELAYWLGEHLDCYGCHIGLSCVHNDGCPGELIKWLKQPGEGA